MNLFGYGQKRTLAELATENVKTHRANEALRFKMSENYLIGPQSPIYQQVINVSKEGALLTTIDFAKLNKSAGLNNLDFIFTDIEVDKLIAVVAKYLESEGCNYTLTGQILTICWPDPCQIKIEEPIHIVDKDENQKQSIMNKEEKSLSKE